MKEKTKVLTKSQRRKKILLLLGALLAFNLFVFGAFYFPIYKNGQKETTKSTSLESGVEVKPSPTSFPFQEITIPHLRSRIYKSSLGEMQQVSQHGDYTSYETSYDSDGLKVYGQLTIPAGEKPKGGWPAIIFVHGYIPPQNYQTFENYASFVDYLARQGFVIFKIDLRGHGNSEGEPGGGYYSADYIIDTLNARAALQSSDFVASDKIGLWGHSMAGNVVARALAARPEIPAIVIWAGAVYTYTDFSEFRIEDNSYQPPSTDSPGRKKRNEMFEKYGQFNPNAKFWKQVPMTNYLGEIKGAISLNHAVDDNVVDIGYSRNLKRLLDGTSIVHELNEYPTGGHNFTGETFNSAMENTVKFFNKYLN
ncbi:MAG: alpha/beta fold hydrolase [Candidatus Levybacteria bacterium]|nr:alpha/beta fold hydrolase [Candidatus Levybacteria bacterium]